MNIANTFLVPSLISLFCLVFLLLGLGVWLLIRKKRRRLWLPTLRLMTMQSSPLPKLRVVKPPLMAFFCFLLSALALLWLSLKPSKMEFSAILDHQNRSHVFFDLSPSNEASSISKRLDYAKEIYEAYQKLGDLTFSHSLDLTPKSFGSETELAEFVEKLPSQRHGTELGPIIIAQLEKLGTLDRLIVVADADKSSWSSFNWRILSEKVELIHASLSEEGTAQNIYIDNVRLNDQKLDRSSNWTVTIASSRVTSKTVSGVLELDLLQNKLRKLSFSLPAGQKKISLDVNVKADELTQIGSLDDRSKLTWSIKVDGPNAIKSDDVFYSYFRGFRRKALLVSSNEGEMFLEDSLHHLQSVLEVLEFDTHRIDKIADERSFLSFPLWIIAGGREPTESFCPKLLPQLYRNQRLKQENFAGQYKSRQLPVVWLMPKSTDANYGSLCHCYSNLADDLSGTSNFPPYCQDLEVREQYIGVLNSVGALQIGGKLNEQEGAWSYRRKIADIGLDIFAMTLPLKPMRSYGITHDMIPRLAQFFLELSGLQDMTASSRGGFPRISNKLPDSGKEFDSNVPRSESQLALWGDEFLPKSWDDREAFLAESRQGLRQQKNPRYWIVICFWVVITLILLEVFWIIIQRMRGSARVSALLLASLLVGYDHQAAASVKLHTIGYGQVSENMLAALARQVGARTSIELSLPQIRHQFNDPKTWQNTPWLWIADSSYLGKKQEQLDTWLRRGGFLIIEDADIASDFKRIDLGKNSIWQAIPPDHELMRSFHLLSALPPCRETVWHGLRYDDRIAAIAIPFSLLRYLFNEGQAPVCLKDLGKEEALRIFINIMMVALTTDYKKDQIHLPEILKRLR